MQQVAIRAVDLHPVDTGIDSSARSLTEFLHDARQLLSL